MSDQIDAAVATAERKQAEQEQPAGNDGPRIQIPIRIASSNRQVVIDLPQDITDRELAEWTGWWTMAAVPGIREQRDASGPKLIVAHGPLPPIQGAH